MRAHTRTHHIDYCSAAYADEKPIPAEIVLDEIQKIFNLPEGAMLLCGYRKRDSLTQVQLAQKLGIKQSYLSNIERGKREIGKGLARKIAAVFKVDYRRFL